MTLHFYNIGKLCSGIDLSQQKSIIDLSQVTFFSPFALIYLGMYLRLFNSLGHRFTVYLPTALAAREYLARQQFWDRFNFDPESATRERLRRFITSTSLNDIVDLEKHDYVADDICTQVKNILVATGCDISPSTVALMISELVDNFAQHSRKNLAALTLQYYPRIGSLRIAVGDCGIGIRKSLSSNRKYAWLAKMPHYRAALEALKPGVSRKAQGGTGFTDVLDGIADLGGQLRLATGDEYIMVRSGKATYGPMNFNLPGVQLELFLPGRITRWNA